MAFRLAMNYGTQPIFKPEELRAAFHHDQLVRCVLYNKICTGALCHDACWLH